MLATHGDRHLKFHWGTEIGGLRIHRQPGQSKAVSKTNADEPKSTNRVEGGVKHREAGTASSNTKAKGRT